jgi:hypothetical protein
MNKITYRVLRYDGGWAYRIDEMLSETYDTYDAARSAADGAAREQLLPRKAVVVPFKDKRGPWRRGRPAFSGALPTELDG